MLKTLFRVLLAVLIVTIFTQETTAQNDRILVNIVGNQLVYHNLDNDEIKKFDLSSTSVNASNVRSLEYNPDLCVFHAIVDFRSTPKLYTISIYGEVSYVNEVSMQDGSNLYSCEAIAYNPGDGKAYVSLSFPYQDYWTETIAEINISTAECSSSNLIYTPTPRPDDADFLEVYSDSLVIGDGEGTPNFTYVFGMDLSNRTASMYPSTWYYTTVHHGYQELAVIQDELFVEFGSKLYKADLTQRPLTYVYDRDLNYDGFSGTTHAMSDFNYDEIFETFPIHNDTSICLGDSILINTDQYDDFLWNNNTLGDRVIKEEGVFYGFNWVGSCLFRSDTFQVLVAPCDTCLELKMEIDTNITPTTTDLTPCVNDSVQLSVPEIEGWNIMWSNGVSSPSQWVKESGEYNVIYQHGDCDFLSASITIQFTDCDKCDTLYQKISDELILSMSTNRCIGESVILDFNIEYDSIVWNDGDRSHQKLITESGTYSSELFIDTCSFLSGSISFEFKNCNDCKVYFPNAFSPNQDNTNDIFRPVIREDCEYDFLWFEVYNRWGEKLYEGEKAEWNGYFMDKKCQQDVYFYIATGIDRFTKEQVVYSGLIHLVH